jgi:acyl-CoA oxidase
MVGLPINAFPWHLITYTPLAGFTTEDVTYLTDKFWSLHRDYFGPMDCSAYTLLTIQYNLAAGTLGPHALKRPELRPLMKKILDFDVS